MQVFAQSRLFANNSGKP